MNYDKLSFEALSVFNLNESFTLSTIFTYFALNVGLLLRHRHIDFMRFHIDFYDKNTNTLYNYK